MITLLKGELSYHDIMRGMTYKEMMTLRDLRVEQILEEKNKDNRGNLLPNLDYRDFKYM